MVTRTSDIPALALSFALTLLVGVTVLLGTATVCNSADYSWVAYMPAAR